MEKSKDNRFVIIVRIEKYIEYMLTILLKLPRTEKFSIGTEVKTSMYCKRLAKPRIENLKPNLI